MVNCFTLNTTSESFKTSVIHIQAPDPQMMQNTFESFCHSVVNKGEQIVHKLLGDQFKEQLDILRVLMSNALFDEKLEKVHLSQK